MNQVATEPLITWWMIASALGTFAFILCGLLWKIGKERWDTHEKKIQAIITYLVINCREEDKEGLRRLLNGC